MSTAYGNPQVYCSHAIARAVAYTYAIASASASAKFNVNADSIQR